MTGPIAARIEEDIDVLAPMTVAPVLAWMVLLMSSYDIIVPAICTGDLIQLVPSSARVATFFAYVPLQALLAGWLIMIVAMMLPTVLPQMLHIRRRSFRRTAPFMLVAFVLGYVGVWLVVGALLLCAMLSITVLSSDSPMGWLGAVVVALLWQTSPWKRWALRRCHVLPTLSAFAPRSLGDAVLAGAAHGAFCAISCWAIMLSASILPHHLTAMLGATALIWWERFDRPRVGVRSYATSQGSISRPARSSVLQDRS